MRQHGVETIASMPLREHQDVLKLIIPLPPSQNHAYITTRQGKRIMTAEHRAFKDAMRLQLRNMINKPFRCLDRLTMDFYWPDKRTRDYDNYEKITLDCLKGILIEDDSCWNITEKCSRTAGVDKDFPRVCISWERRQ